MTKKLVFLFVFLLLFSSSFAFSLHDFISQIKAIVSKIIGFFKMPAVYAPEPEPLSESLQDLTVPEKKPEPEHNQIPVPEPAKTSVSRQIVYYSEPEKPKISETAVCEDAECTKIKLNPPALNESFFLRFKVSGVNGNTLISINTSEAVFENSFTQQSFIVPVKLRFISAGTKIVSAQVFDVSSGEKTQAELARFNIYGDVASALTGEYYSSVFEPEKGEQLISLAESLVRNFLPGFSEGLKTMFAPESLLATALLVIIVVIIAKYSVILASLMSIGALFSDLVTYVPLLEKMMKKAEKKENFDKEAREFWKQATPDLISFGISINSVKLVSLLKLEKIHESLQAFRHIDDFSDIKHNKKAQRIIIMLEEQVLNLFRYVDSLGIERPDVVNYPKINSNSYAMYDPETKQIKYSFRRYVEDMLSNSDIPVQKRLDKIYESICHEFIHHISLAVGTNKNYAVQEKKAMQKLGEQITKYESDKGSAIYNEYFDLMVHKLVLIGNYLEKDRFFSGWFVRINEVLRQAVDENNYDYVLAFTAESEIIIENADLSQTDRKKLAELIEDARQKIKTAGLENDYKTVMEAYSDVFDRQGWG